MNDAQKHVQLALVQLQHAITRFDEALACVKAQGLNDFDGRAVQYARGRAEESLMWAERAVQS